MNSGLPTTLHQAIQYFADPVVAHNFVARLRWIDNDGKPTCPKCGGQEVSFLSTRLVWKCKACKKQFSVKVGTIFEDSPMALNLWLAAIWMLAGCKNGISSYELSKDLGISQKSAWFMLHRIRKAMQSKSFEVGQKLCGEVEADETFVGGKVTNMHRRSKRTIQAKNDGNWGKTVVLGLLERDGRVRAAVAPSRRKHVVHTNIMDNVELGSKLYTDEFNAYDNLPEGIVREFVNHLHSYVQGRVHTNGLENFWSLLKRTLKGTYVSVDPAHLQAYTDEQAFRFNNRKGDDLDRFLLAMSQIAGKRLTFAELTGKVETEGVCAS